jgi:hypothetical protein
MSAAASTPSVARTVEAIITAEERAEAAARVESFPKDGEFRLRPVVLKPEDSLVETIGKAAQDYYHKVVSDYGKGTHAPERHKTWAKATAAHEKFLRTRIPVNIARWTSGRLNTSLIAFTFAGCAPTDAQSEEWMRRWNDDGDLLKMVMRTLPAPLRHTATPMPYLLTGTSGATMLCVALVGTK